MSQDNFNVLKPFNNDVGKAAKWFNSITSCYRNNREMDKDSIDYLISSIQFYSIYVQTGDAQYHKLTDDFLKLSLGF